MSGFGLLDLKSSIKKTAPEIYKKFVFIGEDTYTLRLYLKANHYRPDDFALITSRELTVEDLEAPTLLAFQQNHEDGFLPEGGSLGEAKGPVFYKDDQWRKFTGRARPDGLYAAEEKWFEQDLKGIKYEGEQDYSEALKKLEQERLSPLKKVLVEKIEDLVEPTNYKLELNDGQVIRCDQIFWGHGPYLWMKSLGNPEVIGAEWIEFCESTRTPQVFCYQCPYECEENLESKLYFFTIHSEERPFVGSFDGKLATFQILFDENNTPLEDHARYLRLLIKKIKKIFPPSLKLFSEQERLVTGDYLPCLNFDIEAFEQLPEMFKSPHFVGLNSFFKSSQLSHISFEDSFGQLSFPARAALAAQVHTAYFQNLYR